MMKSPFSRISFAFLLVPVGFWILFFSEGTKLFLDNIYGKSEIETIIRNEIIENNLEIVSSGLYLPLQHFPILRNGIITGSGRLSGCGDFCEFLLSKDKEAKVFWRALEVTDNSVHHLAKAFFSEYDDKKIVDKEIAPSDKRVFPICNRKELNVPFLLFFEIPIIVFTCSEERSSDGGRRGNFLYTIASYDRHRSIFFNLNSLSPSPFPEPISVLYWYDFGSNE